MDATELAELIREHAKELELLVAQLSVAQLNQAGAVGVWSVKDVLAHLAFWQRYGAALARAARHNATPQIDVDIDDATESQNASVVAQYYLASTGAVLANWSEAREELLEQIAGLTEEQLNDPDYFTWNEGRPLLERIAGNSYDHEREHIEQIRQWMRSKL
jgi:hypothetical protein